jgi:hypothetical protein
METKDEKDCGCNSTNESKDSCCSPKDESKKDCGCDSNENSKDSCCSTKDEKKSDCGCSDSSCCEPKPKNKFVKFIFILVIGAAIGIIGFKLYSNSTMKKEAATKNCAVTDSTKQTKAGEKPSCCPGSKTNCEKK